MQNVLKNYACRPKQVKLITGPIKFPLTCIHVKEHPYPFNPQAKCHFFFQI